MGMLTGGSFGINGSITNYLDNHGNVTYISTIAKPISLETQYQINVPMDRIHF